ALRGGLDQLAGRPGDEPSLDAVREVGQQIVATGSNAGLAPLVTAADEFCGLVASPFDLAAAPAALDRLRLAVGLIERVFDACIEGADREQLGRLCHAVSGRELGLGEDDDVELHTAAAAGDDARSRDRPARKAGPR